LIFSSWWWWCCCCCLIQSDNNIGCFLYSFIHSFIHSTSSPSIFLLLLFSTFWFKSHSISCFLSNWCVLFSIVKCVSLKGELKRKAAHKKKINDHKDWFHYYCVCCLLLLYL
jgi:hypothetical protein